MIKMITKKVATTFIIVNGFATFLFFKLCSNITRHFTTKCSTYLQMQTLSRNPSAGPQTILLFSHNEYYFDITGN